MKPPQIKKVGIVGAGTMGQGIAQICALSGYDVLIFDTNQSQIKKAFNLIEASYRKGIEKGKIKSEAAVEAIKKINSVKNLNELKADLIIEAAIEKLEVKKEIFSELEKVNDDNCIMTTNTSSIPVTQISSALKNPDRFLGLHFFNPAHIMPLVEVIATSKTNPDFLNVTKDFATSLKKTPVIAKDSPGFIVNRVARHFYVESLKLVEEKVASFEEVDSLLQSMGFKLGPFRLMDLIGVDTNYAVTETMFKQFGMPSKFRPSILQKQLVDAGFLGKKSGKGFYEYPD